MAQYKSTDTTGIQVRSINVENGSADIEGVDTLFLDNASVGDRIIIDNENVPYDIGAVADDEGVAAITLTAPYAGADATGVDFVIVRDATPVLNFPRLNRNDIGTAVLWNLLVDALDTLVSGNVIGRVLFDHYATVGTSGTGETDLYSDTIPANTLTANGDKLRFEYAGSLVTAGTDGRRFQVYFAGTEIADTSGASFTANDSWSVRGFLVKTGTTTARASITIVAPSATLELFTFETDLTGLDFTVSNIFKITGTNGVGTANEVLVKIGYVEYVPAV